MEILFTVCKKCRGKGIVKEGRITVNCAACKGKGYILTELGNHIQIFLSTFCRDIQK